MMESKIARTKIKIGEKMEKRKNLRRRIWIRKTKERKRK